jgi:hypothetical protein
MVLSCGCYADPVADPVADFYPDSDLYPDPVRVRRYRVGPAVPASVSAYVDASIDAGTGYWRCGGGVHVAGVGVNAYDAFAVTYPAAYHLRTGHFDYAS